jgi:ferredoxin-type protein NapH
LPGGERARQAHERNVLRGGGLAADYAGIPMMDPVAGTLALIRGPVSSRTLVAWLLPVLLALFAGRVFCGWFCPYGTLARGMDYVLGFVRWRRGYRIPERRYVRWLLLAVCVVLGFAGAHMALYLTLPHLLLQQSVYALWLLGGGAALLGIVSGLFLAGLLFGPTIYCSAICPTGATLSALGRARVVKLRVVDAAACGSCRLCDQACWLQLSPRTGDPGPDCDTCARCFSACPRSNLRVGFRMTEPKTSAPKVGAVVALALCVSLLADGARADGSSVAERQPAQVLHAERAQGDVSVALSVIDMTGIRLGVDDTVLQSGVEVSLYVVRGPIGEPNERGELPARDIYQGPVTLSVLSAGETPRATLEKDTPNSPLSTVNRAIYRWDQPTLRLEPGDELELAAIPGWLDTPMRFTVPSPGMSAAGSTYLAFGLAATLVFAGLFALALAGTRKREPSSA